MRDLQLPGRSVVHGRMGAAATSSPLATLTAIEALRAGGNAVDAAIAACAVQCVVEPMSTGVGGDCFALLWLAKEGRAIGINGSGRAPQGLTAEWLLAQGRQSIEPTSVHSVTIPGAVAAWEKLLADHGRLGLDAALAPAIRVAAEGFAVTPRVAHDWRRNADKLAQDANAARIFLPGGQCPRAGEVHRQPQLAETLRAIAREGRDGFYKGRVAADMVAYLQSQGGRHGLDDFARHTVDYVEPISTRYRGVDVLEIPPNGQGITTLMMLNILSGYDLARYQPHGVERFHLEAEATQIAFGVRDTYVADPAFASVPVKKLLSAEFTAELRARIDMKRAMPVGPVAAGGYRDTVYISVVDAERNACSFINSLFFQFGCGLVTPNTGVVFQCRGAGFRVEPGHPNCVAPGKRPMNTIIPALAVKDGKPWLSFGVMGGGYQPVGQTHVLTNILDYGMDPQEAIDSPRCFHVGGVLEAERGVSDATVAGLAALGHRMVRPDNPWGGGQAIAIDHVNGTLAAGSDPRRDGCALAY
jgi:gamma-glutamyltranspeptidase / glutathione hydrolase